MSNRRKAIVAVTAGLATISLGLSVTSAAGPRRKPPPWAA